MKKGKWYASLGQTELYENNMVAAAILKNKKVATDANFNRSS